MPDVNLLKKLAALTASLTPGDKVSADDLHKVRRLLARFLTEEEGEPLSAPRMEEEHELAAFAPELEDLPEDERRDLDEAVAEVARLREAVAAGEQPVEELGVRVFRRELPVLTSQAAGSMPSWAAGRRVDRTIGPFFDELRRPFWFDIFFPVRQVSVVRLPSTTPFLQIPLAGFVLGSASQYKLPAGSIWILSKLLTPTAPAGAYTGLRIKAGKILLSSPATVSGGTLQVAVDTKVTLKIKLDPPSSGRPSMGSGVDASKSEAHLPARATFVFTPAGGEIVEAVDADASIYGNDFHMTKAAVTPTYEPLVNRILVPFDTEHEIKIDSAKSQLFTPEGKARVSGAAWALPVTVASPASLGEAAGAGALAVIAEGGLRATWRGLKGPPMRLGTIFMVEPGRLVVVSEQVAGPDSSQRLELWEESADSSRRSVVELSYERAFTLRFFSEQGKSEALLICGSMVASLDRPLCSDGSRLPVRSEKAALSLFTDASGFSCLLVASLASTSTHSISLALSNALFKTTPPLGLLLYGRVSATDPESVEAGATFLLIGIHLFVPFLPDPYAANIATPQSEKITAKLFDDNATVAAETSEFTAVASTLFALTLWPKPDNPRLTLLLAGLPNALPVSNAPTAIPSHDLAKEDTTNLSALRQLFDREAGGGKEHLKLLDVSTHADHLGIGFGVAPRKSVTSASFLQIQNIDLVSAGRNIRIFTTPQIQWEPVITDPNPSGFPSPLASAGDGGPTLIGANSVTLVPVAPRPLLSQIVNEFNRETGSVPAAALFTLPFGMVAVARLKKPATLMDAGAHLALNQPSTVDGSLKGGLQLSVEAISPNVGPDYESPSLEGATIQTHNGMDPVTLVPLGKSVLSGLPGSAPGTSVEDIFNNEMKPASVGGGRPRVPVIRIDLSGYGASTFSNWYNPNAVVAETSQVRFDVMVGRTAYEVVQVKSILFPWAVPVVRTITIERRREGLVFRKDSGWVAIAAGRYRYPSPTVAVPSGWGNPIASHPGVVIAAHEVRRIRETGRAYKKTIAGQDVVLAEVRFDANFEIEGVVSGQNAEGRVPSRDQVGFVQTEPFGLPLYDVAFGQLLIDEGPLGGPVDCVIDVGGSGQHMRVVRVDVGPAPSGIGAYEFAAAARGALDLPNDGAWSMLRHDLAEAEPKAVDLDSGTPLIREGKVGTSPSDWYRFADPEDLLTGSSPNAEYALMQSSSAHRVLFPRPRIKRGNATIVSTERAVLADPYAMTGAVGLFPERSKCFLATNPYILVVRNDGRYKLQPPTMGFPVPAGQERRHLSNTAAFKIFANYPVSDPSKITLTLDPDAPKAWVMHERKLAIGMDLGPFEDLMTVKGEFYIEEGGRPEMREPELVYGPALGPVNAVIQLLTKVAELLGAETPFGVSMTNPEPKMKASVEINLGLLAKKVFGASAVDADGFFDLWPQGPKVKGSIGAGMSNDPKALSKTLGLTTSETSVDFPAWHGYFYVKLGVKIPIQIPIFGDGEAWITILGNELTSYVVEIQLRWGVSLGARAIGVLSVSGRFYFGVILEAGENMFGIGILVGVSGSASVLEGLFAITVKFELIGLIEHSAGKTEAVGQAVVAAEITVCWFITISFSTKVEVREEISA